jgi:two-component system, LytTR family, response regulator
LKPFDDARFGLALDRAKQKIARGNGRPKQLEHLTVKTAGQVEFLSLPSIDWIEAADYYVGVHVGPKTHLLRRSIAELEQDLDPNTFFRIHRSTIVNLNRIRGLKLNEDGEYTVLLESGTCLRLSRRYRRPLQARLGLRLSHSST